MANYINKKSQYLVGKWNKRIGIVEKAQKKPLTLEKKMALANALEETSQRIRAMEAVNPSAIGLL